MRALKTRRSAVDLGDAVRSIERLKVTPNGRRRHAQGIGKLWHSNRASLLHHRHNRIEPIFR